MKRMRKNNKGFSLVELIIVIAIMVALIAVMGPQYVKYVQSSRDAVVSDAANSVLSVVKAEYASNNLSGTGTITIQAAKQNGKVIIVNSGLEAGAAAPSGYSFIDLCGIDENKTVKSEKAYVITVGGTITAPTFEMTEATASTAVSDDVDITVA